MLPLAVYPLPESSLLATLVVFTLASAALPVYWLIFRPTSGQSTWGIGEMVAIAVLFLLTLPFGATLLGIDLPLTLADLSLVTIVQNGLFVAMPVYVATVRYRLPASTLGVRVDGWQRAALVGAFAAAVATPLSMASESVAIQLVGLVEGPAQAAARAAMEHADDPLRPVLDAVGGVPAIAWLIFLLAVVVPIGEEMFFRGFVYGGLRARWGVTIALLISAAFFAVVHLQIVHGLPVFVLGIGFALIYERTGSLLPAIVAHGVNNVVAVLAVLRGWNI
jgi:hypothetical protein